MMIGQRSSIVFLLAAAGLAASQSLSSLGLSQQCQSSISFAIASNSACLNLDDALNIFLTPANSSIVPAVDRWVQGICAAPLCSNSTLTQAAQNITTGCQSDLSNIGISQQQAQNIADKIVQYYPTFRKVICLQDTKNSSRPLCITELLDDIEAIIGPLSTNNLIATIQGIIAGNSTVSIPKNVTCNDCTQAAWAIIKQDDPSITQDSTITGPISSQCGADFINGSQPSTIVESTGSATSSQGAALGSHISYDRFVTIAAVPLVGMLAGSALLL